MKEDSQLSLYSFRTLQQTKRLLVYLAITLAFSANTPFTGAQKNSNQPSGLSIADDETLHYGDVIYRKQMIKDDFELHDTFWHLNQLQGLDGRFSEIVVAILSSPQSLNEESGLVVFSTPSFSGSFPLYRSPTELKFYPIYGYTFPPDKKIEEAFGANLQKSSCYKLHDGILVFMDSEQKPLIVLSAFQQTGIENQNWKISKFRRLGSEESKNNELVDAKVPGNIVFMNGRVYGGPGCGGWEGSYSISGDILTFHGGVILAGLCFGPAWAQGPGFEREIQGDRLIKKEGDHILLTNKDGKTMLQLVPFPLWKEVWIPENNSTNHK
ncbi:MAG: META domain-containing protein [Terracidiphilus sp.]